MKASETTFQHVIEGAKQYIVPLFQRPYCWDKTQWETLWNDLVELQDAVGPRSHFIGSIVTLQTQSVPEGVTKFLLIDGQQRLTTTFILLTLLRDTARREGRAELADEIRTVLRAPIAAALGRRSKLRLYQQALDQIELAERSGIDYVWEVEHSSALKYFSPPARNAPSASASATPLL